MNSQFGTLGINTLSGYSGPLTCKKPQVVEDSHAMAAHSLDNLTKALIDFRDERNWEQFHSPRNLLLALAGELGELASLFQWETDATVKGSMERPEHRESVEDELADVFAYLLLLSESLNIDLDAALISKIEKNQLKYPVEKARGTSAKYTEL